MDVSHRPRHDLGRLLEDVAADRRVEVAGVPRVDLVVAALVDQGRKVADLEFEPGDDQQIGARELEDERRLRVHEMRILISPRQGDRLDVVASDRLSDRREVLQGGHHAQLGLCWNGQPHE